MPIGFIIVIRHLGLSLYEKAIYSIEKLERLEFK